MVAKWKELEPETGKIQGLADSEWRKGLGARLANAIGPRPASDADAKTAWTVLDGVYEKIRYALEELKSAQETFSGVMATHEGQEGRGGFTTPRSFDWTYSAQVKADRNMLAGLGDT